MFFEKLRRFRADTAGVTALEYGLIAALVALGVMSGLLALSGQTSAVFEWLANVTAPALRLAI